MARLVSDIETTALPLENFDEVQQEYLFREAEKLTDEALRIAKRSEIDVFSAFGPSPRNLLHRHAQRRHLTRAGPFHRR